MTRAVRDLFWCASWVLLAPLTGCLETADLGTLPSDASLFEVPVVSNDAGGPPVDAASTCSSSGDCSNGSFCKKPVGECDGVGACTPMPTSCSGVSSMPVCDCSEMNRDNPCEAWLMGENVAGIGMCPAVPQVEAGTPQDGGGLPTVEGGTGLDGSSNPGDP
jgi:hypothetical protein